MKTKLKINTSPGHCANLVLGVRAAITPPLVRMKCEDMSVRECPLYHQKISVANKEFFEEGHHCRNVEMCRKGKQSIEGYLDGKKTLDTYEWEHGYWSNGEFVLNILHGEFRVDRTKKKRKCPFMWFIRSVVSILKSIGSSSRRFFLSQSKLSKLNLLFLIVTMSLVFSLINEIVI